MTLGTAFHAFRPDGMTGEENQPMSYSQIKLDIADGIATVTLHRPDVVNARSSQERKRDVLRFNN